MRDYGQNTSAVRTAAQTQTARFFSDAGIGPMQAALREFATRRELNIVESARMFAAVDTSIADGAITVWHGKLQYMWWRPITAIRYADIDGRGDTAKVDNWTPLIGTPPYPDWPSGLCSVVGAVSTVLERLNGDGTLDLIITSAAAGVTRNYATKAQIADDAVSARVWSGIHFRTADEVSITSGTNVANYVLDHYFQPTD
ncbi:MAG: vanadium-dependent haloperoxidase [Candidatus Limnocylindria bacterium]